MNELARSAVLGGFCKVQSVKTTNCIWTAIAKMANDHKPPLPWPRQGFGEQVFHPICFCRCCFEQPFPVKMSASREVYCMMCSCFSVAWTRNVYHTSQCQSYKGLQTLLTLAGFAPVTKQCSHFPCEASLSLVSFVSSQCAAVGGFRKDLIAAQWTAHWIQNMKYYIALFMSQEVVFYAHLL